MQVKTDLIGRQMKAVRQGRSLTQKQMAKMLDMRPEQLSRIENGQSYTTFDVALNFCKLFDCELILKHE